MNRNLILMSCTFVLGTAILQGCSREDVTPSKVSASSTKSDIKVPVEDVHYGDNVSCYFCDKPTGIPVAYVLETGTGSYFVTQYPGLSYYMKNVVTWDLIKNPIGDTYKARVSGVSSFFVDSNGNQIAGDQFIQESFSQTLIATNGDVAVAIRYHLSIGGVNSDSRILTLHFNHQSLDSWVKF